jgi:AbiU2
MPLPTLTPAESSVFLDIEREVTDMHYRWKVFNQLFVIDSKNSGKSRARFDLLQTIGRTFLIEELRPMMLDFAFLHVCRITEAAEKKDKKGKVIQRNLVIERLKMIVDAQTDPSFAPLVADLQQRHADIKKICEPIRKHRNKRISHLDLDVLSPSTTVLPASQSRLPEVTIAMLAAALDSISDFVNQFREVFLGSPMMYSAVQAMDDGNSLILYLQYAYEFDQMCREENGWLLHKRVEEGHFGKAY